MNPFIFEFVHKVFKCANAYFTVETRQKKHTYGKLNKIYFVGGKMRLANRVVVMNNWRNLLTTLLTIAASNEIEGPGSTTMIFQS